MTKNIYIDEKIAISQSVLFDEQLIYFRENSKIIEVDLPLLWYSRSHLKLESLVLEASTFITFTWDYVWFFKILDHP